MIWTVIYENFCHVLFSDYYDLIPEKVREKNIKPNIGKKLTHVFRLILYDLKLTFLDKRCTNQIKQNWVIVNSHNNYNAIKSVLDFEHINLITFSRNFQNKIESLMLVEAKSRFIYIPKMLVFILLYFRKIRDRWDFFFAQYGLFETALKTLKKFKPNSILFTNDHTPENRAYMLAARKLSIPTGYIQHACVRDDFGELLTNYAYLEGEDSLNKYTAHGNRFKTKIFLIGIPRFVEYIKYRSEKSKISTLGIAYNTTDNIEIVYELTESLMKYGFRILIRSHPFDTRTFNINSENVRISNARVESPFDFLSRVDSLIACESSIHLEAILLNKPSYYYDLNPDIKLHDLYGFIKNKLIKNPRNFNELINSIMVHNKSPVDVLDAARYYVANCGTEKEKESLKITKKLLRNSIYAKHSN